MAARTHTGTGKVAVRANGGTHSPTSSALAASSLPALSSLHLSSPQGMLSKSSSTTTPPSAQPGTTGAQGGTASGHLPQNQQAQFGGMHAGMDGKFMTSSAEVGALSL